MELIKVKNATEGGKVAFDLLKDGLDQGIKTIGLPTGNSPLTLYKEIAESNINFEDILTINLDEFVGMNKSDKKSFANFMDDNLFKFKKFRRNVIPDGRAEDLTKECQQYEQFADENPIDIMFLGIGQNGHIAFNEPGSSVDSLTRVVTLTEQTVNAVEQGFGFKSLEKTPKKAITMGIKSITKSKKIVLLAYGDSKAPIIKKLIESEIDANVPASILRSHPDFIVIADEKARKLLKK
ncbi:glucosamine-6-phosphate deaminase [Lactobacillus sp. ESL0731]|uniref:glucosamine-6-phosphate deaminase n=1 Tax=unclassified Lactobacillus TaxID=2620435 RepID=UPI0023FA431A|nr:MULTISPECIES: glucosamine-6-phosphate deaminase [unclassified Lactobacillus]WEV50401.1 glucosamine-6-phosphate deaminase [Lactobacillus sp. ESL0700]WEV61531.1 glucosamine-6-phosphate deaminase [Lactobacillus sp. ESL0731]